MIIVSFIKKNNFLLHLNKVNILTARMKNRNSELNFYILFSCLLLSYQNRKTFQSFIPRISFKLTPSLYQFHQHFTSSFLLQKSFEQLFCTYGLGLYFFGTRKWAQMLNIKCWWNWPLRRFLIQKRIECLFKLRSFQRKRKNFFLILIIIE